ncbi:MAG TPA: L-serine ammonia-lyase, iron-sulfur-dependent, subunit alpha [Candidatus Butyricicoccus avistercoris]|uniref:UPF0597 protein H9746_09925 n=1 Tax=Candidatus Butyricicoccus avistercoris TaxID=2838518 RepID=A0A9D1TJ98_9FIRM|nr:L-serine ammonia-lyase, iron-sulfur-dependent, subunit alpha [Candidatus Butyricicoccus avistercoris]
MALNQKIYDTFIKILKEELVPAFGCTEPIAIAYCAAKARDILGCIPKKVAIEASGNIIKNVKSVVVPNTNGLKGIPAAAAAGIVAGDSSKKLEVISEVSEEKQKQIKEYLDSNEFDISPILDGDKLEIRITVYSDENTACVHISRNHCNIVEISKNDEVLYKEELPLYSEKPKHADRSDLSVKNIIEFAETVDLELVKDILKRQIDYNYKIALEGLENDWGANIGKILIKTYGEDVKIMSKALAAAGSDARMGGCELPVVINSGSGNQGITVSVPVITYAKHLNCSEDKLYRALLISNLIAIHIKHGIGPLSAFCGAVSAGCAAGCGIAYLYGGHEKEIDHTLVNSLATVSGIFCDGAKASCAAKIASSVEAGILGYFMYMNGQQFYADDGIVSKGVENTIKNVCRLGANAMNETDEEIIRIMTQCD